MPLTPSSRYHAFRDDDTDLWQIYDTKTSKPIGKPLETYTNSLIILNWLNSIKKK